MRAITLKSTVAILFAVTFLVGSFFINSMKVNAAGGAQSFPLGNASSYTLTSYTNSAGGTTTVARVGCDPQSGDKYDINTGKLCSYVASTKVACAIGSGDKYDIYTGRLCSYMVSDIRIGCAPNSNDIFDINTGSRCIGSKYIASSTPASNGSTTNTNNSGISANVLPAPTGTGSTVTNSVLSPDGQLVAKQTTGNTTSNLTASGAKTNSLTGPLSIRTIMLLILIILGVGYAIYSFMRNDEPSSIPPYTLTKDKKLEPTKPVTQPQAKITTNTPPAVNTQPQPKPQSQPANVPPQPKPQEQHVNTPSQSNKIPDSPLLTHTQPSTPSNPQMPLNMPSSSNSQGGQIKK